MNEITISANRYEALVRCEHEANCLKNIIWRKFKEYGTFSREEIKMLYDLFVGDMEVYDE